ncbi:hypothetical protein EVA_02616 [gut metagenome]|uniref:Lipoprotein n=1 Tax=gut metagenome TaxID=749906 RepID=J9D8X4_9ZZZZ
MKQIYLLWVVLLIGMSSCGGRKKSEISTERMMYQIDSVDQVTGLQRMQVSRVNQTITCNGTSYELFVERTPCDSLPAVKSELGLFADNRIVVRLTSAKGERVFAKTFTKQTFSGHVNPDNLRYFILEGLVFDEEKTMKGKNIVLAASICYPQTDLYIPFSITITPGGKMSISKNEDMEGMPPLPEED